MLVHGTRLGEALASHFSNSGPSGTYSPAVPRHTVVLMRGHGVTIVASNIEECVLRAIYTQKNAMIQTAALSISAAHLGLFNSGYGIKYLDEEEAAASTSMTQWSVTRPWKLWLREVKESGLYVNCG
jgi:ribulose-5-phosphate 4-epimerase/fuculose-1-phosphate aldolase